MNYYQHPFVSNSDLTRLKLELSAPDEVKVFEEAFRFGTLVHAVILEPHTVDQFSLKVARYSFTAEELATAKKMRSAFYDDPFCASLVRQCSKEVEMYHTGTQFSHNGIDFTLNTRRKYDLWHDSAGWGGDIKSTTATTQTQFEAAMAQFDYDRARVFYAAGPMTDRDVVIGISKKNFKIFKVFMKRDDAMWQRGEEKMNELAFKKYMIGETVA